MGNNWAVAIGLVWGLGLSSIDLSIVRGTSTGVGFLDRRFDACSFVFLRVEVVMFFVLVFSVGRLPNEPMPPEDGSNDFLELCLEKSISPSSC